MRAPLHHAPLVEHQDQVGLAMVDSRWAITIDVRPCSAAVERVLDERLVLGVEVAGGLVEDDDAGSLSSMRAMASRCFSPPESR